MDSIDLSEYYLFALQRERDGAGDSGRMLECLTPNEEENKVDVTHNEVKVGSAIKVGSFWARTMQWQDWWRTTLVDEIEVVEKTEESLLLKLQTKNSTYHLRCNK